MKDCVLLHYHSFGGNCLKSASRGRARTYGVSREQKFEAQDPLKAGP